MLNPTFFLLTDMTKRVSIKAVVHLDPPWNRANHIILWPAQTLQERIIYNMKCRTAVQWELAWKDANEQAFDLFGVRVVPNAPPEFPLGYHAIDTLPDNVVLD